MNNAQHSAASVEHYTPPAIVDAARLVMGGIDLDPASCELAQEKIVKADRWMGAGDNALGAAWVGRVFLNPPGRPPGGTRSLAPVFWRKLVQEWKHELGQAIYVAFSLEQAQQFQEPGFTLVDFPVCYPKRRVSYYRPDGKGGVERGNSPTHASAIVYMGNRVTEFREVFGEMGAVVVPRGYLY